MWQKTESKLELAADMVRQVMLEFNGKKNVIILCDRWYVKKDLVCLVDEYENLGSMRPRWFSTVKEYASHIKMAVSMSLRVAE